jgi:hypothetical protein
MPLPVPAPVIDGRTYDELRDEALRRIPVHNPAWTNFNATDPGVTLIELFAFMTENLLYRSNQIPERNRLKFLSLLGIPLQPSSPARGLVVLANENGPLETLSLSRGLEVSAGSVPFRTDLGMDLLPIEARAYARKRVEADGPVVDQYRQLFASFAEAGSEAPDVSLYETVPLRIEDDGIDLVRDTVDASLWVALLTRTADKQPTDVAKARRQLGGRVLNLGIVPVVAEQTVRLGPTADDAATRNHLRYLIPETVRSGPLPTDGRPRLPSYRAIDVTEATNVLVEPGVVQVTLPEARALDTWRDLEPLEPGVGEFPPALEDQLAGRVITWLRIQATSSQPTRILWAGINAAMVTQRVPVEDEALPDGTGDPDQVIRLARRPVVPGSVRLVVEAEGLVDTWDEVEDLTVAGPEIAIRDAAAPPGRTGAAKRPANVFVLDAEAGELRFGDGDHGRRPAVDARLRASYDVSDGTAGNVGPDAISSGAALPPGVKVTNPVQTWGGTDAESTQAGEKRIRAVLTHGERLVTAQDHCSIAAATPGVDVGRVEVLPAFDPRLAPSDPGDAPGAVTLMVMPRYDPRQPDAPQPDRFFLDAICRHLDRRRLVTSELFLRGPVYVPIWVSVGIETLGDRSIAETRESVRSAIKSFLSPLPATDDGSLEPCAHRATGWPLRYAVQRLELLTRAGRADGVRLVRDLFLAGNDGSKVERIEMRGLALPQLMGLSVVVGDPVPISDIQGVRVDAPVDLLPVPFTPEEC